MNYRKNHDLNLSDWGPYSKKYIGISHIPSVEKGKRFDISIFPGLYRRGVTIPNVMWESDYHPWEASTDLKYYSHRHQLLWKDQIYCDISYSVLNESEVLFCCRNVNNTDSVQALVYHHVASLNFPPKEADSKENLVSVELSQSESHFMVGSLEYNELHLDETSPFRNLSPDGIIWGEERDHGFTNGAGLGQGFGASITDKVSYNIPEQWDYRGKVNIRCRLEQGKTVKLSCNGAISGSVRVLGTGQFEILPLECKADSTLSTFQITCDGKSSINMDGIIFSAKDTRNNPVFIESSLNPRPLIIEGPGENTIILKYDGLEKSYGISWDIKAVVREFEADEIDSLMRYKVHEHNYKYFKGPGQGHFTDIFTHPVYMEARSELYCFGKICCGTDKEVREKLSTFDPSAKENRTIYNNCRSKRISFDRKNKYSFSISRMAATALTNVVYPVRVQGSWVRHNTPGRWWDSLYTWDSGFIGLGFSSLDQERAFDNLNASVTLPGNKDAAFIHHGSPVPTQFYLFQEIYNRSGAIDFLRQFYPQMLQYHRFMTGRHGTSTIGSLKSGLLKTWDYFYSSGGWDDYPAQVYLRNSRLENNVSPVITTAMGIRTAKILKGAASILGEPIEELDKDIHKLSLSLQKYTWDSESGYFSYIIHDSDGNAGSILKNKNGINYNCGFDGIYPVAADACTPEQQKVILEKMFSRKHLWTEYGLTAIDQSAPYFRNNGYWVGTVWMSHQWVFWKSMLDLGKQDEAYLIASTALDLWKTQVEDSYCCFEHFITSTGKGAGWHHFGGLSSPVLNWFSSYHIPGNITAGHNTWITSYKFSDNNKKLKASLFCNQERNHERVIIVSLNRKLRHVEALWKGKPVKYLIRNAGVIEILLPADGIQKSTLEIRGLD